MKRVFDLFLRSGYNYDRDDASLGSALECPEPTMTKQSHKEECDINTIVRRFGITGQLPVGVRMPSYGDFSEVTDYHTAMNAIVSAKESFDQMPSNVRFRFNNDPDEFVAFCSREENRSEAVKLGLIMEQASVVLAPDKPVDPVKPDNAQPST